MPALAEASKEGPAGTGPQHPGPLPIFPEDITLVSGHRYSSDAFQLRGEGTWGSLFFECLVTSGEERVGGEAKTSRCDLDGMYSVCVGGR